MMLNSYIMMDATNPPLLLLNSTRPNMSIIPLNLNLNLVSINLLAENYILAESPPPKSLMSTKLKVQVLCNMVWQLGLNGLKMLTKMLLVTCYLLSLFMIKHQSERLMLSLVLVSYKFFIRRITFTLPPIHMLILNPKTQTQFFKKSLFQRNIVYHGATTTLVILTWINKLSVPLVAYLDSSMNSNLTKQITLYQQN